MTREDESVSARQSRVAWPGMARGGGDLDSQSQQQIRNLVTDFGFALEDEANSSGVNIFTFPLFREFNILAALTKDNVYCAFSASAAGLPVQTWLDWRNNQNPPSPREMAAAIEQQLGWTPVSVQIFPTSLLSMDSGVRMEELRRIAQAWVQGAVMEAERQARIVRVNPIFKGRDFLIEKDLCFVLMPFREPFERLYRDHVRPVLEGMGHRVMRADDIFTPTPIIDDIWQYINRARFLVADVTGKNPNVFYELGIAHTIGKDVIILTQNEDDVPFDLKHLRHFLYVDNEAGWVKMRSDLEQAVNAIIQGRT